MQKLLVRRKGREELLLRRWKGATKKVGDHMRDQLKRESRVEFGNHQHWGERWGDAKAVTVGVNQRRRPTVKRTVRWPPVWYQGKVLAAPSGSAAPNA